MMMMVVIMMIPNNSHHKYHDNNNNAYPQLNSTQLKTNEKMNYSNKKAVCVCWAALIPFHTIRSPMTTDRSYHIYIFGMMHKTKYQYLRSIYDHDSITILFSYAVQVKYRHGIKKFVKE